VKHWKVDCNYVSGIGGGGGGGWGVCLFFCFFRPLGV